MKAKIKSLAIILYVFWACIAMQAQKTYIWTYSAVDSIYELIDFDLETAEDTVVYQFHKTDFPHHVRETFFSIELIIRGFEFDDQKENIYFIESFGLLYRYHIATDSMHYLGDVTPNPFTHNTVFFLDSSRFNRYTSLNDIRLVNDSTLLTMGNSVQWINLNSGVRETIYQASSIAEYLSDSGTLRSYYDFITDSIVVSSRSDIIQVHDYKDIRDDELLCPEKRGFYTVPLTFLYQANCDSQIVYTITKSNGIGTQIGLYEIDISSCSHREIRRYDSIAGFTNVQGRLLDIHHENKAMVCIPMVDLDSLDRTRSGIDYYSEDCQWADRSVCDSMNEVIYEGSVDSIEVFVLSGSSSAFLEVLSGNYNVHQYSAQRWTISNAGTSSLSDFEAALRNTFFTDPTEQLGSSLIAVVPWASGRSGDTARAELVIVAGVDAGRDSSLTYCAENRTIALTAFLTADQGGMFYDENGVEVSATLDVQDPDTFELRYIVAAGKCSDTAIFQVQIYALPDLIDVPDFSTCQGEAYELDLSLLTGSIEWEDGSTAKQRSIRTEGSYSYTHTSSSGCSSSDTFVYFDLSNPMQSNEEEILCAGDSLFWSDRWITEAGQYSDTIPTRDGCDSLIRTLEVTQEATKSFEQERLEYCAEDPLIYRPDETYESLMVNGLPSLSPIQWQAGRNTIVWTDAAGCAQMDTVWIEVHSSPVIHVSDIIDVPYSEGYPLEIEVSGDSLRYQWMGDVFSCTNCADPAIISAQEGWYSVEVSNAYACKGVDSFQIDWKENSYYVPNILNVQSLQGVNRSLHLISEASIIYDLRIYDRWGGLMYEGRGLRSNQIESGWIPDLDQIGVYVYQIEFDVAGRKEILRGTVSVVGN